MLSPKFHPRLLSGSESISTNRKRLAEIVYWLGVLLIVTAAMTAWAAGIGIVIGAFVPLPFTLAAALRPTRFSIALALLFWGCWCLALYYLLT